MKHRILAGAAAAALTVLCTPVSAATAPEAAAAAVSTPMAGVNPSVDAFYASRRGAPLWLIGGADSPAARELIAALQQSPLDGFANGPALAAQAQLLLVRAQSGDAAAAATADRLMSAAWVAYVSALQTPPPGMTYADRWVTPRRETPSQILARAAYAPSLAGHVRDVARVNPLYAQLRSAAWAQMQAGSAPDPRVLTSLERLRDMPFQNRYIIVDTAGARLYMIESGRIVDSMKVIVGRPDPSTQTPMLASTIYYATLNPYWHVSPEMVRSLIARNVLDQGLGYLKTRGYQVQPGDGQGDELLDPAKIDWRAVADGRLQVRVRQLPGPANSMGRLKFGFPNASDIYLHDTPGKELFAQDDRSLSHGCIRLEDADRLGRWLLGREPQVATPDPEQNVLLPTPVPIYLTYVTAQLDGGKLGFVDDSYGRDSQIAALR